MRQRKRLNGHALMDPPRMLVATQRETLIQTARQILTKKGHLPHACAHWRVVEGVPFDKINLLGRIWQDRVLRARHWVALREPDHVVLCRYRYRLGAPQGGRIHGAWPVLCLHADDPDADPIPSRVAVVPDVPQSGIELIALIRQSLHHLIESGT